MKPTASVEDFQRALQVEPSHPSTAALAKRLSASGEWPQAEMELARALRLEHTLASALQEPVPADVTARLLAISHQPSKTRKRAALWLAAAGITGLLAVSQISFRMQNNAFAAACAEHLAKEPYALARTSLVPEGVIARLFSPHGLSVDAKLQLNYLMPCEVNGMKSLHTVVQSSAGPVTVLIVPDLKQSNSSDTQHAQTRVRVRAFEGGTLVLIGETNRDFDATEAAFVSHVKVIQS
jgi:hypothetical protein